MKCTEKNELIKRLRQNDINLRKELARLEEARLQIAEVGLVDSESNIITLLQIVSIGNTPDGLVLRVSK